MPNHVHGSSYFIWRDGLRWQYHVEISTGERSGWRLTEGSARRAARRRLHRDRHPGRLRRHRT